MYRSNSGITIILISLLLAGCQIGPRALESGYPQYSQTIRKINDEHMLLNIIRLRYAETPVFLQISSITSRYNVNISTGAGGAQFSDGAGLIEGSVGAGYGETPSITYSLPDSREYFGRMLAPLSADQLGVLAQAGGGFKHLLMLGVKKFNRLENLNYYSGWEIIKPKSNEGFKEVLDLIVDLEKEGLIDFAYNFSATESSSPFSDVDMRAIPEGDKVGLKFFADESGKYVAYTVKQVLYMRFSKKSDDSPKAHRLRELLQLSKDQYSFQIVDADDSTIERMRNIKGKPAAAFDPDAIYKEIVLHNRSMMEIMFYVSKGIEVPEEHLQAGIVDLSEDMLSGMLTIHSSKERPDNAAIMVFYEGYWFYIAADDLKSRRTFLVLNALFAATGGTVPGGNPVFTIPLN